MGRSSLFLCGGFAIILGIVQLNIYNSQTGQTQLNVDYVNQSQARIMSMSGMDMGIKEVMVNGFAWRPDPQPWIITVGSNTVEVYVDDHGSHPVDVEQHHIRIRAESDLDGRAGMAYAILKNESIFPPIPGAMGFYGESSVFNLGGNAKVFGDDKNPDGTAGDDEDKPGIAAVIDQEDLINPTGQAHTIEGDPPYSKQDLDAQELQDYIDEYTSVAEDYVDQSSIGDTLNPKIVKLTGDTKISDNSSDAGGVLIIPPNVTLELRGTFTFHGLIIVQGTVDIRGNVSIFGSMLFGDNSLLEIDEVEDGDATATGNTTIQYSSSALSNVDNKLAPQFDKGAKIVSIYD